MTVVSCCLDALNDHNMETGRHMYSRADPTTTVLASGCIDPLSVCLSVCGRSPVVSVSDYIWAGYVAVS